MTRPLSTTGRMHLFDKDIQQAHRYSHETLLQKPYELKPRGHSPSSVVFSRSSNFPEDKHVATLMYSNDHWAGEQSSDGQLCIGDHENSAERGTSPANSTPDTSFENDKYERLGEKGLQFVPALEVNNLARRISPPNITTAAAASVSWDAILLDDNKNKRETPFPLHHEQDNRDAATSVSGVRPRKVGDRIAQLASIFSSRATVQLDSKDAMSSTRSFVGKPSSSVGNYKANYGMVRVSANPPTPVSPAQSSGSSAYIGWPGTQDKHGQTVMRQSSNDDSSIGAESSFQRRRCLNGASASLCNKVTQKGALTEVNRWNSSKTKSVSNWDDSSSGGSDDNTPLKRRVERRQRKADPSMFSTMDYSAGLASDKSSAHYTVDANVYLGSTEPNTAESHLAPAVVKADTIHNFSRPSVTPSRYTQSDVGLQHHLFPSRRGYQPSVMSQSNAMNAQEDQSSLKTAENWTDLRASEIVSPDGSNFSKTSSAYLSSSTFQQDNNRHRHTTKESISTVNKIVAPERISSLRSAANVTTLNILRKNRVGPPTEFSLEEIDRRAPPHRTFPNAEGYMGLLDKTKDVPCLLDTMDSDSMSSSKATSVYSENFAQSQQQNRDRQEIESKNSKPTASEISPPSILRNKNRQSEEFESESDIFDGVSVSKDSDVFDNLSAVSPRKTRSSLSKDYPARIAEEDDGPLSDNDEDLIRFEKRHQNFRLVVLAGGITTIQTSDVDYSNRQTASDFDDQLTASEVSSNGYTRIPGFDAMIAAGTSHDSSLHGINGNIGKRPTPRSSTSVTRSLVLEDIAYESDDQASESDEQSYTSSSGYDPRELAQYCVLPSQTKKLLGRYRELSDLYDSDMSLEEFEREEDEHKAFALVEMRSRIMEKDIERGLERRGGTTVVDDIVTTRYYRSKYRIRDAVIVCKAWRDGASVVDVVKAFLLSQRDVRTYHIQRRNHPIRKDKALGNCINDNLSMISGFSSMSLTSNYHWEPVKWLDDTDVLQYKCPSLGSRNLKGFEIFTIGDCQSMLLKLTNERCMELRRDLNAATSRQIHAEEMLKEENDFFVGEMTETEFEYLASMEEVKMISKKLVKAEKAFTLVRDRITKLIAKYESIISKIERGSSVVTYESSYYTEHDSTYWNEIEHREREMWEKRAQRAELRAEIAAREAFLAKQETRMLHEVKQRELDELRQRLFDVQSEVSSPVHEKENSAIIAKSLVMRRHNPLSVNNTTKTVQDSKNRINDEKVKDVKQRFRERMAKKQDVSPTTAATSFRLSPNSHILSPESRSQNPGQDLFRSAGEEMYQQMDFYERSLNAVERTRF